MKNKNTNLLICLEGVNSHDVRNILDYIYNGNVKIYEEHIDRFLEVAQRFKLEGLQVNNRQDKSPEEITQQLKKAEDQKPLGGKNRNLTIDSQKLEMKELLSVIIYH